MHFRVHSLKQIHAPNSQIMYLGSRVHPLFRTLKPILTEMNKINLEKTGIRIIWDLTSFSQRVPLTGSLHL